MNLIDLSHQLSQNAYFDDFLDEMLNPSWTATQVNTTDTPKQLPDVTFELNDVSTQSTSINTAEPQNDENNNDNTNTSRINSHNNDDNNNNNGDDDISSNNNNIINNNNNNDNNISRANTILVGIEDPSPIENDEEVDSESTNDAIAFTSDVQDIPLYDTAPKNLQEDLLLTSQK